jgi:hypothetical protein
VEDRQQQAETRDSVNRLHSRQQEIIDRQQLGDCQRSVVLKMAKPLPSSGTANHLQQWFEERLRTTVVVQQVQLLGSKEQDDSGTCSPRNRRFAYKVKLGSPGERTAVLRAKPQALRGSTESIDAMLTPEQPPAPHASVPPGQGGRPGAPLALCHT